ncbi:hypothetical protein Tco_0780892 [Tanacetum coccineum]
MPPKRTSTSEALAMTQAAIRQLVADSVTTALDYKRGMIHTYVRRFQELATLCPTMVLDSEKMMEVFIGGLPRSIEGNVTASKPQTLEEAISIARGKLDQVNKAFSDLLVMPVERKGIMQISAERPPTTICHGKEPTC